MGVVAHNKLSVETAAKVIGASTHYVRLCLQQNLLPFGHVIHRRSRCTYFINVQKLSEFSGVPVDDIWKVHDGGRS